MTDRSLLTYLTLKSSKCNSGNIHVTYLYKKALARKKNFNCLPKHFPLFIQLYKETASSRLFFRAWEKKNIVIMKISIFTFSTNTMPSVARVCPWVNETHLLPHTVNQRRDVSSQSRLSQSENPDEKRPPVLQ